jgi:hypothetical protein
MLLPGASYHYLYTSDGSPPVRYVSLVEGRAALGNSLKSHSAVAKSIDELPDGKWLIGLRPVGSITIWLENELDLVVRLVD